MPTVFRTEKIESQKIYLSIKGGQNQLTIHTKVRQDLGTYVRESSFVTVFIFGLT